MKFTTMMLMPHGSLILPTSFCTGITLPVHSLPECIVEGPTAVAPIKTGVALFVSGLLHGIEPGDVVNYCNDSLRKLPHGVEG